MNEKNFISNKIINEINSELLKGNNWMAYNTVPSNLDTGDVYLFNTKNEAMDFAENNISEFDNYRVKKVGSIYDVLNQMPDREKLFEILKDKIGANQNKNKIILTDENHALYEQLETLGFGKKLSNAISFYIDYPQERFQLPVKERNEKEAITYWLYFQQNKKPGNYQLFEYQATLHVNPDIPHAILKGIDTTKLDNEMKQFDWSIDHHAE